MGLTTVQIIEDLPFECVTKITRRGDGKNLQHLLLLDWKNDEFEDWEKNKIMDIVWQAYYDVLKAQGQRDEIKYDIITDEIVYIMTKASEELSRFGGRALKHPERYISVEQSVSPATKKKWYKFWK